MDFKNPEFYHLAMAQLRDTDSLVSHGWFQEPHWNITECRFSFCAKVYRNVRMINGTMSSDDPENVPLEAVPNSPCWGTKAPPPNSMYDFKGPACMEFTNAPNTELPSGANSTFLVQYAGRADAALLGPLLKFKAEYKLAFRPKANGTELKQVSKTVTPHGSNPGFNVLGGMGHRGDNISNFMHRVAHSMTNQVRTSSDISGKIYGTALHMETFIVVRWKWLGLPVAVIVFGVAFLVTTIALNWTKKTVLWKSNDLPLLTHGLEGWDADALAGVETSVAIRRTAGEMRARLGRNADGELRFLRA
ncbi:uncharacterized protein K452DRAFT_310684 [Neofusicoccum parvum]|uniref:Uncharacterized protein K452DRAFT_310684 n=1 Tax=Neofusicoccum parvum TaxID=310453 RepID=A0ACB5SIU7_9PEZI|nr:uncharacterized protein K452DRAFT_310684 [Neofusicoccum parvum]